jgi:large subunit ribosomal protein L29
MTAVSEFVIMGDEELAARLDESRRELLNLRFQLATGQLDNTARLGHVRRDVARIMTVLRQRELAPEAPAPVPSEPRRRRTRTRRTEEVVGDEVAEERAEAAPAAPEAEAPEPDGEEEA